MPSDEIAKEGAYMLNREVIKKKMLITISAIASISILAVSISPLQRVTAAPAKADISESVAKVVSDMEGIMVRSYLEKKREVGDIAKLGYDYDLTMQNFCSRGLPYSEYDYLEFIAAYTTIQNYCIKNNIDMGNGINKIDFLRMDYEDAYETEYISKKVDKYIKNEDETYSKDGYTYITEPRDIATYKQDKSGNYVKAGTERVDLETKDVKYADITLSTIDVEDVYRTFGIDREDFEEEEKARLAKLVDAMGKSEIGQTVFIEASKFMTDEQKKIIDECLAGAETVQQKQIISLAASIIGRVPYEWGGKSDKAGFDSTWYTFDDTGRQKGLDCSGYVQWILRTANIPYWKECCSTSADLRSSRLEIVSSEELLPGDLGFFYPAGTEKVNHVGMYLGNGKWIHCSSSANTVTISDNIGFCIFRRFLDESTELDIEEQFGAEFVNGSLDAINDDDIMLMAKIVQCEARGEGYNGWVAVAQVIRNRIQSDRFDENNIREVVSAQNQFVTYTKAMNMSDMDVVQDIYDVCVQVMNGTLRYYDENVIGFKVNDGDSDWNGWRVYDVLGNHAFYTF